MNLYQRITALKFLGDYMLGNDESWQLAKIKAERENSWFVQPFIELAVANIAREFLDAAKLEAFAAQYKVPDSPDRNVAVGVVMAGNIPLVGFHDFLCVFLSGHKIVLKPSARDEVLITHLVHKLWDYYPGTREMVTIMPMLKGCDAYIATGSNNSGRYFEYYFSKYPSIIRRNRSSAAILTGEEPEETLGLLADDILLYFGLGCRNVSKLYVPAGYDFVPLIKALDKYAWMSDHNKFRNNYDYNLSLHILNGRYYMSSKALLILEDNALFSPIAQLNYAWYDPKTPDALQLPAAEDLQCLAGKGSTPFGAAQSPTLSSFADGVDTMDFLRKL